MSMMLTDCLAYPKAKSTIQAEDESMNTVVVLAYLNLSHLFLEPNSFVFTLRKN